MVQIFVDQQKIKGFQIEKIDTGYGTFYLIPKEDVSMFDKITERFRDDPRSLNILDARLKWFIKSKRVQTKPIPENIVELKYCDDIDYQVFVDGLVSEIKA